MQQQQDSGDFNATQYYKRQSVDPDSSGKTNQVRASSNGIGVTLFCKAPKLSSPDAWSDAHERILQDWKITAFIDMWLQSKSADYYRSMENMITFPVVLLSSASSVTLFSSKYFWTKFIVSIANVLVGVLTAFSRQMKCNELYQEHSNTCGRYQALIRAIDTCLDLPRHMRPNPDVLIEKLGCEIDSLSATHLTPPYYVIKVFEKTYGPIHQLMFGDDIIQLLKKDVETRKQVKFIQKQDTKKLIKGK